MKEKKTYIMAGGSALRRVLISAVSIVSLAACSETEPDEEIRYSDIPVSFDAFGSWTEDAGTRAETSGSASFADGDAMGVTAYWIKDGGSIDKTVPNFMYNQEVTCSSVTAGDASSSGTWSYSPVKYWPVSGTVNFYAYSPYAASGDSHIALSENTATGRPALTYTNSAADIDLMAASSEGLSLTAGSTSSPTVSLLFRHLLAKVRFKFTYVSESDYRPVLHMIRFDAPVKGRYDYGSGGFDTDTYSFSSISKFTKDVAGVVINSGADGHVIDEFTCYLLPCAFPFADGTAVGSFKLLLNNVISEYTPKKLISVEAGKEYVLNFKIEHTDTGSGFFVASYSLWEDGGTIEGNLQ